MQGGPRLIDSRQWLRDLPAGPALPCRSDGAAIQDYLLGVPALLCGWLFGAAGWLLGGAPWLVGCTGFPLGHACWLCTAVAPLDVSPLPLPGALCLQRSRAGAACRASSLTGRWELSRQRADPSHWEDGGEEQARSPILAQPLMVAGQMHAGRVPADVPRPCWLAPRSSSAAAMTPTRWHATVRGAGEGGSIAAW